MSLHEKADIVVVNYQSADHTMECVEYIHASAEKVSRFVIVDNSNEEELLDLPRRYTGVEVLRSGRNLGFGKGCNFGAERCRSDYILFLNPDARIKQEDVDGLVRIMEQRPEVAISTCKMFDRDGKTRDLGIQWFPSPLHKLVELFFYTLATKKILSTIIPFADPFQSGYVRFIPGAVMMVRRNVFELISGFDEDYFMYCEDAEICLQAEKLGFRMYYSAEQEAIHYGGETSRKSHDGFSVLMMAESIGIFIRKHYGNAGLFIYRAAMALSSAMKIVFLVFTSAARFRLGDLSGSTAYNKYSNQFGWALLGKRAIVSD